MGKASETTRRPIDILTSAEVGRLIRAIDRRSPIGIRNCAIIATQYRGLLRITESLTLRPQDYDPHDGSLRVQAGKGDKYRVIGLDPLACSAIDAWIAVRPSYAKQPDAPLYCTHRGLPIRRTSWNASLELLATRAGLAKRVHPHGLRHAGACALAAEGVDIRIISIMLGHSSLAVTHRYLAHLSPRDVIQAMRNRAIDPALAAALGSPAPSERFPADPLAQGCA